MVFCLLAILAFHFFGDFLLQDDWMATNKSTSWYALLCHTGTYATTMFVGFFGIFAFAVPNPDDLALLGQMALMAAGVTFVAHTLTDAVTSRITSYLWKQERRHDFFVVIGFDQLLHAAQLFPTWYWVLKIAGIV